MSNLVQKTITDKNGVRSTRWVKPEAGAKQMQSDFPAPLSVGTALESREDKLERAVEIFLGVHYGMMNPAEAEDYEEDAVEQRLRLKSFDSATLDEIISLDRKHIYALETIIEDEGGPVMVRDYLNLPPHLIDTVGDLQCARLVEAMGLYHISESPKPDTPYPESRAKQCAALVYLTDALKELIKTGSIPKESLTQETVADMLWADKIADDRMAEIALERYDDIDAVVSFMMTRKTNDVDRILEMLDSKSPAVAEGIL